MHELTSRLRTMAVVSVLLGWVFALGGRAVAFRLDASVRGAVGTVATACFGCALAASPGPGVPALVPRARAGAR